MDYAAGHRREATMTDVARPFAGIKLTRDHCAGLREVVRPYNEIELDPR
ncbi:hypothetical protein LCGC14_2806630, partial [marine sediment metagenome]